MLKVRLDLRNVVAIAICLAGITVFLGCKKQDPKTNPPGIVSNLYVAAGNRQVSLSWDRPSDNGGSEITGYEVTMDNWTSKVTKTASEQRSHTYTGLTNGTQYTFKIRAVNANGAGEECSETATPSGTPGIVSNLYVAAGNGLINLSWDRPSDNGGSEITGYEVTMDNWTSKVTKTASEQRSHTYNGLTNGMQYTVKVRAVNANGAGEECSETATPAE